MFGLASTSPWTSKLDSREEAEQLVAEACEKLLSNPIMERFEFRVFSAEEAAL